MAAIAGFLLARCQLQVSEDWVVGTAGIGTCDPLMSQRLYPNGDRGLSERGPLKWDRTGFDAGDTVVGAQDVALRYSAEAVTFHSNGTTHLEPIQRAKTRLLATGGTALVSEFQGHQFGSPVANAMGDIISGDIEDAAFLQDTANDDVGMGMASVVMIDRNPVEARIEILLYLSHEVAGKTSQIGHFIGTFGRHDKTELMPIVSTPLDKSFAISFVLKSRIGLPSLPVPIDSIAFKVAKVGIDRLTRRLRPLSAMQRLFGPRGLSLTILALTATRRDRKRLLESRCHPRS